MGCTTSSEYADETKGKLAYPLAIEKDIQNRSLASPIDQPPVSAPCYILGYTQSFAEAKLYSFKINDKDFLVYSAMCYLVILDCLTGKQNILINEDRIVGMDCRGKICLTAIRNGTIILWDLQFAQKKLLIKLPSTSTISSVSLTDKYIFCTDTQIVNHNIYCYDLRTAKLKAQSSFDTAVPTLKGLAWGSNCHATVSSEGVWFSIMKDKDKQIEMIKGMFKVFPKTAMSCLAGSVKYLLSGSVDGFLFLWNSRYECQRVVKVGDECLTQIFINRNSLIVSTIGNNTRIFDFTVKWKQQEKEDEEDFQTIEAFNVVLVGSDIEDPLIGIAISRLDENSYFGQTRSGTIFSKMIPSIQNKIVNSVKIVSQFYGDMAISGDDQSLWFLNCKQNTFILNQMKIATLEPQKLKIDEKFTIPVQQKINKRTKSYLFIPDICKIVYASQSGVFSLQIFNKQGRQQDSRKQLIFELEKNDGIIGIHGVSWLKTNDNIYVIVLTQHEFQVLKQCGEKWEKVSGLFNINEKSIQIDDKSWQLSFQNNELRVMSISQKGDTSIKDHSPNQTVYHIDKNKNLFIEGTIGIIYQK